MNTLYNEAPEGSAVVCFDEFGPVEVRPQAGAAWAPAKKPARRRADYNRHHGVRHYLAAYDVYADRIWMHKTKRKRWREVLAFFKVIRRRYPADKRIYIVLDNFSPHHKKEVRDWCAGHNVVLVFIATNASWMNRIECHFAPIKTFVICNSDYPDHNSIGKAMQDYLRWRNKNASNKKIKKAQNTVRVL